MPIIYRLYIVGPACFETVLIIF